MNNENGIVRVKEKHFSNFYHALNQASEMSDVPVQIIYELWLNQVVEGLSREELVDELLTLIDDMEASNE